MHSCAESEKKHVLIFHSLHMVRIISFSILRDSELKSFHFACQPGREGNVSNLDWRTILDHTEEISISLLLNSYFSGKHVRWMEKNKSFAAVADLIHFVKLPESNKSRHLHAAKSLEKDKNLILQEIHRLNNPKRHN